MNNEIKTVLFKFKKIDDVVYLILPSIENNTISNIDFKGLDIKTGEIIEIKIDRILKESVLTRVPKAKQLEYAELI